MITIRLAKHIAEKIVANLKTTYLAYDVSDFIADIALDIFTEANGREPNDEERDEFRAVFNFDE